MQISIDRLNDVILNKEDVENIDNANQYLTLLENFGNVFVKLCNYAHEHTMTVEEQRRLKNIESNAGYFLLHLVEHYGK